MKSIIETAATVSEEQRREEKIRIFMTDIWMGKLSLVLIAYLIIWKSKEARTRAERPA